MTKSDQPAGPPQGNTLPRTKEESSPRLPHEHDESSSSQDSQPRSDIKQAHADVSRGLVDTDRSSVTNEVYNKSLKQGDSAEGVDSPKGKGR